MLGCFLCTQRADTEGLGGWVGEALSFCVGVTGSAISLRQIHVDAFSQPALNWGFEGWGLRLNWTEFSGVAKKKYGVDVWTFSPPSLPPSLLPSLRQRLWLPLSHAGVRRRDSTCEKKGRSSRRAPTTAAVSPRHQPAASLLTPHGQNSLWFNHLNTKTNGGIQTHSQHEKH